MKRNPCRAESIEPGAEEKTACDVLPSCSLAGTPGFLRRNFSKDPDLFQKDPDLFQKDRDLFPKRIRLFSKEDLSSWQQPGRPRLARLPAPRRTHPIQNKTDTWFQKVSVCSITQEFCFLVRQEVSSFHGPVLIFLGFHKGGHLMPLAVLIGAVLGNGFPIALARDIDPFAQP